MPWILCAPARPSDSTGDAAGSTATTCTSGFMRLRYAPAPLTVPPVPTPATKMSTSPPVASQISGPVVASWTAGFAGFVNCPTMNELGISAASSSARAMAPFMPSAPSVSTSSAP